MGGGRCYGIVSRILPSDDALSELNEMSELNG